MTFTIETAADHDGAIARQGVRHIDNANVDVVGAGTVEKGYSLSDEGGSALAAYWPLDETSGTTANDVSGNGNDGTINGAAQNQNGVLTTPAYGFDGTDDFVGVQDADELSLWASGSESTVSMWFRVDASVDPDSINAKIINKANEWGLVLQSQSNSSGQFAPRVNLFGDNNLDEVSDSLDVGVWYHYAVTLDEPNDEVRTYIDGAKIATTPSTDVSANSTSNLEIGSGSGGQFLHGLLDECRLYNRKFTDAEIGDLYDAAVNTSEIWYERTDTGDSTSLDLTTTTTIPAGASVTVTVYEDVGNDDSGPNSVTDPSGATHNYENSASVTLSGGTNESNTLTGFDGGGSTNAYIVQVELDGDGSDPTLDSPQFDRLSADTGTPSTAGSVLSTSSGVIQTDSNGVIQTE